MLSTLNITRQAFRLSPLALITTVMMWQTGATAGSLSGSFTTGSSSNVNLSAPGITQWAVWGQGTSNSLAPTDKSFGMTGISNLTNISNGNGLRGLGQFGQYGESTFTWTNGTVTPSASNVTSGLQHDYNSGGYSVVGEGFSLTVPANTAPSVLTFYTTVHDGLGRLVATLGDGSAPAITLNTTSYASNLAHTFSINYQANSETTLNLNYILTNASSSNGNVAIQGVATTYAPVPGPLPVLGVASAFGMSRRLRRRIASTQSSL
jgi:hypothetical protein